MRREGKALVVVACAACAVWWWTYWLDGSLEEYALIHRGKIAAGVIERVTERWIDRTDRDYDDEGGWVDLWPGRFWEYKITYRFEPLDGGEHHSTVRIESQWRREYAEGDRVLIDYDPRHPDTNRLHESGNRSIYSWLLVRLLPGVLVCGICLAMAVCVLLERPLLRRERAAST